MLPGFGVAGIAGMVSFTAGCIFAFRAYGVLTGGLTVGLVVISVTAILAWFPKTRAGKAVVQSESLAAAHSVDSKLVVGDEGVAESDLRPSGVARFGELRESVVTDGEFLSAGARVRVAEVEGARGRRRTGRAELLTNRSPTRQESK